VESKLLSKKSLKIKIKHLLQNDWIIIAGNLDIISQLEYSIYTPNTEANKDFISITPPTLKHFFMGKKTQRLKKFLKNPYWDDLLGLNFKVFLKSNQAITTYAIKQDIPDLNPFIEVFL
jgi:hypothetical protein